MTRRLLIITDHCRNSRGPANNMNWEAFIDGWEPGDPMGYGASEEEAVTDLYVRINDREDDDEERARHETGAA